MWWIALQWSIALVIAAAFPADPTFALLRSVLVALGVTLQLVIASSLWALVCWQCDVPAPRNANDRPLCLASVQLALRETFEPGTSRFRYAVALAVLITGYIAPLFAFGGLPEPAVALPRVSATAIGGGVALAAHFLYVARPARRAPPPRS